MLALDNKRHVFQIFQQGFKIFNRKNDAAAFTRFVGNVLNV